MSRAGLLVLFTICGLLRVAAQTSCILHNAAGGRYQAADLTPYKQTSATRCTCAGDCYIPSDGKNQYVLIQADFCTKVTLTICSDTNSPSTCDKAKRVVEFSLFSMDWKSALEFQAVYTQGMQGLESLEITFACSLDHFSPEWGQPHQIQKEGNTFGVIAFFRQACNLTRTITESMNLTLTKTDVPSNSITPTEAVSVSKTVAALSETETLLNSGTPSTTPTLTPPVTKTKSATQSPSSAVTRSTSLKSTPTVTLSNQNSTATVTIASTETNTLEATSTSTVSQTITPSDSETVPRAARRLSPGHYFNGTNHGVYWCPFLWTTSESHDDQLISPVRCNKENTACLALYLSPGVSYFVILVNVFTGNVRKTFLPASQSQPVPSPQPIVPNSEFLFVLDEITLAIMPRSIAVIPLNPFGSVSWSLFSADAPNDVGKNAHLCYESLQDARPRLLRSTNPSVASLVLECETPSILLFVAISSVKPQSVVTMEKGPVIPNSLQYQDEDERLLLAATVSKGALTLWSLSASLWPVHQPSAIISLNVTIFGGISSIEEFNQRTSFEYSFIRSGRSSTSPSTVDQFIYVVNRSIYAFVVPESFEGHFVSSANWDRTISVAFTALTSVEVVNNNPQQSSHCLSLGAAGSFLYLMDCLSGIVADFVSITNEDIVKIEVLKTNNGEAKNNDIVQSFPIAFILQMNASVYIVEVNSSLKFGAPLSIEDLLPERGRVPLRLQESLRVESLRWFLRKRKISSIYELTSISGLHFFRFSDSSFNTSGHGTMAQAFLPSASPTVSDPLLFNGSDIFEHPVSAVVAQPDSIGRAVMPSFQGNTYIAQLEGTPPSSEFLLSFTGGIVVVTEGNETKSTNTSNPQTSSGRGVVTQMLMYFPRENIHHVGEISVNGHMPCLSVSAPISLFDWQGIFAIACIYVDAQTKATMKAILIYNPLHPLGHYNVSWSMDSGQTDNDVQPRLSMQPLQSNDASTQGSTVVWLAVGQALCAVTVTPVGMILPLPQLCFVAEMRITDIIPLPFQSERFHKVVLLLVTPLAYIPTLLLANVLKGEVEAANKISTLFAESTRSIKVKELVHKNYLRLLFYVENCNPGCCAAIHEYPGREMKCIFPQSLHSLRFLENKVIHSLISPINIVVSRFVFAFAVVDDFEPNTKIRWYFGSLLVDSPKWRFPVHQLYTLEWVLRILPPIPDIVWQQACKPTLTLSLWGSLLFRDENCMLSGFDLYSLGQMAIKAGDVRPRYSFAGVTSSWHVINNSVVLFSRHLIGTHYAARAWMGAFVRNGTELFRIPHLDDYAFRLVEVLPQVNTSVFYTITSTNRSFITVYDLQQFLPTVRLQFHQPSSIALQASQAFFPVVATVKYLDPSWRPYFPLCHWRGVTCSTVWRKIQEEGNRDVDVLEHVNTTSMMNQLELIDFYYPNVELAGFLSLDALESCKSFVQIRTFNVSGASMSVLYPLKDSNVFDLAHVFSDATIRVDFSSNILHGYLRLYNLPSQILHLDFDHNWIVGVVNSSRVWNRESLLRYLSLSNNTFSSSYSLPANFLTLISPLLEYLDLSFVELAGTLPNFALGLDNISLTTLNLAGNHLTGEVPWYATTLPTSLVLLNLSHNQLLSQADINDGMHLWQAMEGNEKRKDMMHLQILDLSDNQFGGFISFTNLIPSLRVLNLASNLFQGDLDLTEIHQRLSLNLDGNPLLQSLVSPLCPKSGTCQFPPSLNISVSCLSGNNGTTNITCVQRAQSRVDGLQAVCNSQHGIVFYALPSTVFLFRANQTGNCSFPASVLALNPFTEELMFFERIWNEISPCLEWNFTKASLHIRNLSATESTTLTFSTQFGATTVTLAASDCAAFIPVGSYCDPSSFAAFAEARSLTLNLTSAQMVMEQFPLRNPRRVPCDFLIDNNSYPLLALQTGVNSKSVFFPFQEFWVSVKSCLPKDAAYTELMLESKNQLIFKGSTGSPTSEYFSTSSCPIRGVSNCPEIPLLPTGNEVAAEYGWTGEAETVHWGPCDGSTAWRVGFHRVGGPFCHPLSDIFSQPLQKTEEEISSICPVDIASCIRNVHDPGAAPECSRIGGQFSQLGVCYLLNLKSPKVLMEHSYSDFDCGKINSQKCLGEHRNKTCAIMREFQNPIADISVRAHCRGKNVYLSACGNSTDSVVLAKLPTATCQYNLRVECSPCLPYIEPHANALPYLFLLISSLKDVLFILAGSWLFARECCRSRVTKGKTWFILSFLPYLQGEEEEWKDIWLDRLNPQQIESSAFEHCYYKMFGRYHPGRALIAASEEMEDKTSQKFVKSEREEGCEPLLKPQETNSTSSSPLSADSSSLLSGLADVGQMLKDNDFYEFYLEKVTLNRCRLLQNAHDATIQSTWMELYNAFNEWKEIEKELSEAGLLPHSVHNFRRTISNFFSTRSRATSLVAGSEPPQVFSVNSQRDELLEDGERSRSNTLQHALLSSGPSADELVMAQARLTAAASKKDNLLHELLKLAKFRTVIQELDALDKRFTPQPWMLSLELGYALVFLLVCFVESGHNTYSRWDTYQAMYFRYANSCVSIGFITNALLRRLYINRIAHKPIKPDFFICTSVFLMLPPLFTHVLVGAAVYCVITIPVSLILFLCFKFTLKWERQVFPKLDWKAVAFRLFARITLTTCLTLLFQTTFNYAVLFYEKDRLGLSYWDVLKYEAHSRRWDCFSVSIKRALASLMQFLSTFV